MYIVSLSGADGIGKSQQISLLQRDQNVFFGGPLTDYSTRWPKLSPTEHSEWWFKTVPFEEFLSLIAESLMNRRRDARERVVNIQDRGVRMFMAVCSATLMTR